jgi:hypothetical protein
MLFINDILHKEYIQYKFRYPEIFINLDISYLY